MSTQERSVGGTVPWAKRSLPEPVAYVWHGRDGDRAAADAAYEVDQARARLQRRRDAGLPPLEPAPVAEDSEPLAPGYRPRAADRPLPPRRTDEAQLPRVAGRPGVVAVGMHPVPPAHDRGAARRGRVAADRHDQPAAAPAVPPLPPPVGAPAPWCDDCGYREDSPGHLIECGEGDDA